MISKRMYYMLFVAAVLSPSAMILPPLMTAFGDTASYLAPLVSFGVFVVAALLFWCVMSAPGSGLSAKLEYLLGTVGSRIVLAVLGLWSVLLASVLTRYFAERVISTFLDDASAMFVAAAMLITVGISLCGGLRAYARLNEILLYMFGALFLVTSVCGMVSNIQPECLVPISFEDTWPVISASWAPLGVLGLLLALLPLSDHVPEPGQHLVRNMLVCAGITCGAIIIIMVVAIGTFGASGVQLLSLPYFLAIKNIAFLRPFEQIGAVIFSMWIVADFACLSLLTASAVHCTRRVTTLRHPAWLVAGVLLVVFGLAIFALPDNLVVIDILYHWLLPTSAIALFALPAFLALVRLVRHCTTKKQQ